MIGSKAIDDAVAAEAAEDVVVDEAVALLNAPGIRRKKKPAGIVWPSFHGAAALVGTSPSGHVTVYVDPTTGAPGLKNAHDLLADADRIVTINETIFGTAGHSVNVIVFAIGGATDGSGGADHMACDFVNGGNIEVCASFGQSMRCSALFEAELSECAMNGQLCGLSTGEALSRWCSMVVSDNALSDFATVPQWARDAYPNWVDNTEQTDQGADSTGCGLAFISWLIAKKGATLKQIAPAMVSLGDTCTFTQLYNKIIGVRSPWSAFLADVHALGSVTSDNPFNAGLT